MKVIISSLFLLVLGFTNQAFSYGAGAIDSNHGSAYGFSHGFDTAQGAANYALSECGGNCSIVLQFNNACGAYAADQASGSTAYGWAIADNENGAKRRALANCRNHGGTNCVIRVWGCD